MHLTATVGFFGAKQIASGIGNSRKVWVDAVQRRIAVTSSMLLNIRSIRMTGLSQTTMTNIQEERVRETNKMASFRWYIVWQNAVQNLPWALSPAVTFAVIALSKPGSLDTAKIFTSLSIITLLTDPTAKLLSAIPATASSLGCIDRIQKFLLSEPRKDYRRRITTKRREASFAPHLENSRAEATGIELEPVSAGGGQNEASDIAVQFEEVTARPAGASDAVLHDVSFSIAPGTINAVIGSVASGKSTLLKTILGEAEVDRGTVSVQDHSVAYCSQTPWLPDTTIKKAICGHFAADDDDDVDTQLYQEVVYVCALNRDLSLLPAGDDTSIGSSGGILSGGQKQRVSLARALFVCPKMLLLDDFVSAIDSNTRKLVVQRLLGPSGFVKKIGCTVIMSTHATSLLKYADKVLMLSDGKVEHDGTYEQLVRTRAIQEGADTEVAEDAGDHKSADAEISAVSANIAEANERADLRRRVGDLEVYKYYFNSIGWFKASTFVGFTAVHVFAVTFTCKLVAHAILRVVD